MALMTRAETRADVAEFSGFYTANFGRIATALHAYLGDRWEAQDLTQEAFCRAFDRWNRISAYERPEAWVRQVAWNLATNRMRHLRVAMRHLAGQREEQVDGPTPDRVALVRALADLPPKHRLAIVLHHIDGLSTSEIAEHQGVAEGTVRSWLSRGRSQLAEQLVEAPMKWDTAPAIDETLSMVRRRRAIRRGALAVILAILVALPIAIILRGKGSEPPFIGPTAPPVSPGPAVLTTPAAKPISSCTGKVLTGMPIGTTAVFHGGDPTGRYQVGLSHRVPGAFRPVLWTDGAASIFDMPGAVLTGIAVNSRGVVAGSSDDTHSGFKVWTYHDGRLEVLMETPERAKARKVVAINARGDILLDGMGTSPPAVRLAGPAPVLRELPVPAGVTRVTVQDMDDNGTIVGYADAQDRAVVWTPDLTVRWLATPGDGWRTTASRIRGEWVVGSGRPGSVDRATGQPVIKPLRWNLRTGEVTQLTGLYFAEGVTAHGWVLGFVGTKPVIDMNGKHMRLPSISAGTSGSDPYPTFISDDGRVIGGSAGDPRGNQIAVGWTCS